MKKFEIAGMIVYQFVWDFIDSNAYIVVDKNEAVIIDPINTGEFWKFIDRAEWKKVLVILTHEHFDHISGLNELRKKIPCTVYAQKKCSENIGIATRNLSSSADALTQLNEEVMLSGVKVDPFVCKPAEIEIDDKLCFQWMRHHIAIVATPGHSAGSVCVVVDDKIAFTGDSLLQKPIITRLPGGSKKVYRMSTKMIVNKIAEKVEMIFPGHGNIESVDKFIEFI